MKTSYVAIITVLMSSAVSLEAQDTSDSRQGIPDARAYADVLPNGKNTATKKVEPSEAVVRNGRLGQKLEEKPRTDLRLEARTPVDDLAIDRVIQEAKMRLEVIAEKSSETAAEAEVVLDEALALLAQRLKQVKARKKKAAAEKKDTPESGVEVKVENPAGSEKVTEEVSPNPKPGSSEVTVTTVEAETGAGQPAPGEALPSKSARMYRWAEQLRTLAGQLVEEADRLKSRGN